MAHKSIKEPPDGQSFSPWAERCGLSKMCLDAAFQRGPLFRSGYAPEPPGSPRIDPLYYSDEPDISNAGRFGDLNEVDRLFISEIERKVLFPGMQQLWQIGPLSQSLKFSDRTGHISGGHHRQRAERNPEPQTERIARMVSEMEMIVPNEQSWFPFFKRDRWFNGVDSVPILNGQPWSVDHPVVWFYMSIILELANRILSVLIQEQHPFISTLLYGYIGDWDDVLILLNPAHAMQDEEVPEELVLLSYQRYKRDEATCDPTLKDYMEQAANHSPAEYRTRLEMLLGEQKWGFVEQWNSGSYAITHTTFNSVITINALSLRLLIEGNATLAERCILHELCHAILRRRYDELILCNQIEETTSEVYLDFGGAAEMGLDFERTVFGGELGTNTISDLDRPPLALYTRTWPVPWLDRPRYEGKYEWIPGHSDFGDGKVIEITLVPAEFAAKLLSEAFWKDEAIPRKTDNFFHRTPIFTSRTINDNSKNFMVKFINPIGIDPSLDGNALSLSETNMLRAWQENKDLWFQSRVAWWGPLKNAWEDTPWCRTNTRFRIASFGYAYRERDLGTCSRLANTIARDHIEWSEDVSREDYADSIKESSEWIFHAIGLLMMASLPIQDEDKLLQERGYIEDDHVTELPPSSMAAGQPSIKMTNDMFQEEKGVYASEFFDPFTHPNSEIATFNQIDYLDLVLMIIQHLALSGTLVPTPWLNEIMRVEKALRAVWITRNSIAVAGFRPERGWAGVWDFQVPPYDPENISRWPGPPSLEWVRVRR